MSEIVRTLEKKSALRRVGEVVGVVTLALAAPDALLTMVIGEPVTPVLDTITQSFNN